MKALRNLRLLASTLVETILYSAIAGMVGLSVASVARTGGVLSLKNAGINRTHEELRSTLDRVANCLRVSRNLPTLLNASGANVSTGPAAGIHYDRIVGEPYALDPVSSAGNIASTATSLTVCRSTEVDGPPPIPSVDDLLVLGVATGTIRAKITSVTVYAPSGGMQRFALSFSSSIGKPISWGANQPQWAKLVRHEAYIVMPSGGKKELRYYPAFEPVPNLADPSKYKVITDQIGTAASEANPFNVIDQGGDKFVTVNLPIKVQDHDKWLQNKESNQMNSYFRMNMQMTSRLRPRTTN